MTKFKFQNARGLKYKHFNHSPFYSSENVNLSNKHTDRRKKIKKLFSKIPQNFQSLQFGILVIFQRVPYPSIQAFSTNL